MLCIEKCINWKVYFKHLIKSKCTFPYEMVLCSFVHAGKGTIIAADYWHFYAHFKHFTLYTPLDQISVLFDETQNECFCSQRIIYFYFLIFHQLNWLGKGAHTFTRKHTHTNLIELRAKQRTTTRKKIGRRGQLEK